MGLNEKFFATGEQGIPNLKLHLDASDTNSYPGSGNIWYDLSGNGNDATKSGSTAPGWSANGYFNFDGSNDKMQVPGFYGFAQQTWSLWVYPDANERTTLLTTYGSTITEGSMNIEMLLGLTPMCEVRSTSGTKTATSSTTNMSKFNWHMITGTSDGTNVKIYVDGGGADSTTATVNTLAGSVQPMVIGYEFRNNRFFLNGRISKIRAYDRALTPAEITELYNEGE